MVVLTRVVRREEASKKLIYKKLYSLNVDRSLSLMTKYAEGGVYISDTVNQDGK